MLRLERDISQPVFVVEGAGAGDEGKGKILVSLTDEQIEAGYEVVSARGQGGGNAGHTAESEEDPGVYYDFHQIPSGVANLKVRGIIGNGFINPIKTLEEIKDLEAKGLDLTDRLVIGSIAHFVLPYHIHRDRNREKGKGAQGTTGSGMAFVASDKAKREGITGIDVLEDIEGARERAYEGLRKYGLARSLIHPRGISRYEARDLANQWTLAAQKLRPLIVDGPLYLHEQIEAGRLVDIEAAQAFLLDLDHGKFPWTSSDSTLTAGIMARLGLPIDYRNQTIGVYKILPSKVGGGPFPTRELDPEKERRLAGDPEDVDGEYGTTTGRPREVGYPDLPSLRRYIKIGKPTLLAITKVDCLDRVAPSLRMATSYDFDNKRVKIAPGTGRELNRCSPNYEYFHVSPRPIMGETEYGELPKTHRAILEFIEADLETEVGYIGTGPGNRDLIKR
jgi:adenylosuccinate synthase